MTEKLDHKTKQDPQKLARTAIHLLEQKIHDEFGYDLEIGAELEFVVKAKDEFKDDRNPLGLASADEAKKAGFTPSLHRSHEAKDILFPNNPFVAYCYKEIGVSSPYFQYEAVISHEVFNNKMVASDYSRAIGAARAIEKTHADISGLHHDKIQETNLSANVDAQCQHYPFDIDHINNGLHINLSINNCNESKNTNVFDKNSYIVKNVINTTQELIYLLGTNDNSMTRYNDRDAYGCKKINTNYGYETTPDYIENAIPSASSNPYYAILVTLLGAYRGLQMERDGISAPENRDTLVESTMKAKATFEAPDNPYRQLLNELDPEHNPNLGDEFWEAIAKTPPSTEPRLYQKQGLVDARATSAQR